MKYISFSQLSYTKPEKRGKDGPEQGQETGLMDWKTYQMVKERAEGEERRRKHQKGQKSDKRAKKQNSRPEIKQNGCQNEL